MFANAALGDRARGLGKNSNLCTEAHIHTLQLNLIESIFFTRSGSAEKEIGSASPNRNVLVLQCFIRSKLKGAGRTNMPIRIPRSTLLVLSPCAMPWDLCAGACQCPPVPGIRMAHRAFRPPLVRTILGTYAVVYRLLILAPRSSCVCLCNIGRATRLLASASLVVGRASFYTLTLCLL